MRATSLGCMLQLSPFSRSPVRGRHPLTREKSFLAIARNVIGIYSAIASLNVRRKC